MKRPLAVFCAAFAAGCALAQYALAAELLPVAAFAVLAAGALGFFARAGRRTRIFLPALGMACALLYSAAYLHFVSAPNEALSGATDDVVMELCGYAVETDYGAKATVRVLGSGLHGKAIYYGDASLLALEPGSRVRDTVRFNSASDPSGSGETLRSFTSKGVFLLLYSRGEPSYESGRAGALRYAPQRMARRIGETIGRGCGEREAGFLRALLLGDRRYLDEEDAVNLSEAGVYHITAVSGLHCMFLVELTDLLLRTRRRRLRCAVTLPLLFFYAAAAGASPSILRACIMISMTQVAPLFERESDPPTALSFALGLILLGNPCAIASVSLQLSFSAVAGMVWLTPRLMRRIDAHGFGRAARFGLASFAATLGALVFSTPVSAWYFRFFSIVSFVGNLLCLGVVSLIFAVGLSGALAALLLAPVGPVVFAVLTPLIRYVLLVAQLLEGLPLHAIYFNTDVSVLWLLYVYAVFAVCLFARRGKRRWWAALALALSMYAAAAWLNTLQYDRAELYVTALDVGQGESVALLSGGHGVLVDCGSSNSFMNAGDIAADYLMSAGVRRLDAVVLTHYHADHANGLPVLLARVGADAIYLPDIEEEDGEKTAVFALAERYGVPVRYITEETDTEVGDMRLTVYPPVGSGDANELGLTVLCSAGEFDALITGDMDTATEHALLEAYTLPDIEVLFAGHHGSRYSTGKELLERTAPEVGVVSVGTNSYGHPTREALLRLTDAGVEVYRTDLQGSVYIRVN